MVISKWLIFPVLGISSISLLVYVTRKYCKYFNRSNESIKYIKE